MVNTLLQKLASCINYLHLHERHLLMYLHLMKTKHRRVADHVCIMTSITLPLLILTSYPFFGRQDTRGTRGCEAGWVGGGEGMPKITIVYFEEKITTGNEVVGLAKTKANFDKQIR